jgi:hypothetical protein
MSRSWLSLVCVLTAVFALGGRAYGGATGTPFGSNVCPAIDATLNMGNPTATGFQSAATVKDCIKLCDRAASLCRSFSKRSTSCDAAWAGTVLSFNKANCLIVTSNATDRRACIQSSNANHDSMITGFKSSLVTALANCDGWKATCEASCVP